MRCAHVIPYMTLRAGGPVVVVDRLGRETARRGIESLVLTTDAWGGDQAEADALAGGDYEVRVHAARFRRFAFSPALVAALDDVVPTCDLVCIHTLWTHATAAAARACQRHGVPYVVMPHGMLDPHSRSRKPLRKLAYGHAFEFPRVRRAHGVLYTTEEERRLAESSLRGLPPGHIVPLGTDAPPDTRAALAEWFLASRPHLRDRRVVVFLSRVHPKKGLDLLIDAMAHVVARRPDVHLLVIGPDEGGYWRRIERRVNRRGMGRHVTRIDMLHGASKWAALAAGAVYVLPSYQENFAIAAAEALRIGTPVILSDRVNIAPDVAAHGAGCVVPCEREALAAALDAGLDDPAGLARMSEAATALAASQYTWSRSADAMMDAFARVLGRTKCQTHDTHAATIESPALANA